MDREVGLVEVAESESVWLEASASEYYITTQYIFTWPKGTSV